MSAPDAKAFLSRVVPWPAAGEQGYINAHYKGPNFQGMAGRAFKDLDSFMDYAIGWGNSNPSYVTDMYFCLSQQAKTGGVTDTGRVKAVRSAKDATFLKAIWADVDGYKSYPTKAAAFKAIGQFVRDSGYPTPSAIVDSGGGWHIYWFSKTPLAPEDWRRHSTSYGRRSDGMDFKPTTSRPTLLASLECRAHLITSGLFPRPSGSSILGPLAKTLISRRSLSRKSPW